MYVDLVGWRRTVAELYAEVRTETEAARAHQQWRAGRDDLYRHHPSSPLAMDDPLRESGIPYWPYDPAMRFTSELTSPDSHRAMTVPSSDGDIKMTLAGQVHLGGSIDAYVDVWWLDQYAGGLFIPLRDGTAGTGSYGGGRYLLDTAKGADLGSACQELVLDLNFLYHPSCRYSPEWSCPLAPRGNRVQVPVRVGECMTPAVRPLSGA